MAGKKILMVDNYDSFTDGIVISPGPKAPADAGISKDILLEYGPRVKTLGVCLGHQCIGEAFGGRVVRAKHVMHGKTSMVRHDSRGVFKGVPSPFPAARYHSLVVDSESLPECLEVSSETEDGVVMGVRHRKHPVEGIQFHPESFMTEPGMLILENFLEA
jgi:anthranilate synthase component 2